MLNKFNYVFILIVLSHSVYSQIKCSVTERLFFRDHTESKVFEMKQISNLDMVKLVVDTEKFYASLTEYEEDDFLMNFSYNPKNLEGVITRGTFVSGELSTSLVYRDKVYRILCIKN